ncbi:MAG: biotin--[acetyl-CoA-carboxylase] ligase [Bacteroidia bacterium]|nr:biotin--[acetyl-CoA-carboxylase] ligase [Bacteroidia bacterium]
MPIIKLNAIDSTNSYLKELCSKNSMEDYTTVVAKFQTKGRGQMGTSWQVEGGKNLTCSVFKHTNSISVEESFSISIVTSLAIIAVLRSFNIPKLYVKWPNDILSEDKKICGILIENVIKNNNLEASIIGIGLNVNQTQFKNLPKASSLKIIKGQLFDLDELVQHILKKLEYYFDRLEKLGYDQLRQDYESLLFRKDKPSSFKDKQQRTFPGFIKGIDRSGNLKVLLEDDILRSYDLKDIELLY